MSRLDERFDAERTIDLERYAEDGYESRSAYLRGLADQWDLRLEDIEEFVDLMGPEEDFDGLVVFLEDHADELAECGE